MNDSLENADSRQRTAESEKKYALEKKQQQLLLRQKENERLQKEVEISVLLRNVMLFTAIVSLFGTAFFIRRYIIKSKRSREQIDFKNRSLALMSIKVNAYSKAFDQINQDLEKMEGDKSNDARLKELKSLVKNQLHNGRQDRDTLKYHFEQVHPEFFRKLGNKSGLLTPNDYRLCAFIKIKMDNKEIAQLLNISQKAIHQSRYRLRKKLKLSAHDDLNRCIETL